MEVLIHAWLVKSRARNSVKPTAPKGLVGNVGRFGGLGSSIHFRQSSPLMGRTHDSVRRFIENHQNRTALIADLGRV